jgi:hypothetical protein
MRTADGMHGATKPLFFLNQYGAFLVAGIIKM